MCGILGELSREGNGDPAVFKGLLDLSRRRGPDQQRIWQDSGARFGFNRLAILDVTERGMQPVVSPSGRFVVVLNGEIYNFRSLQTRHGIAASELRSGSDVEVVSQLCDRLSILEMIGQLNGMFALAVFDTRTRELVIARDFAGIKPLFYAATESRFLFASQFDQIFRHPEFARNLGVSGAGVRGYLEIAYMQAPDTVFEGVRQALPGEAVLVDASLAIRRVRVTEFPADTSEYSREETDANLPREFIELFGEVVSEQMVSDVPLGTFLSGGIDSPLVAATARAQRSGIKAFTFNVRDPALSELEDARRYSRHLDLELVVETLEAGSVLDLCDEHFRAFSEPFGDHSSLPTYVIAKLARRHLTVLLSGDGGDEVFWGYPRFLHVVDHAGYFKYPRFARRAAAGLRRRSGHAVSHGVGEFETIGDWQMNKHSRFPADFTRRLFGETARSPGLAELYDFQGTEGEEVLNWLRWNEFHAHMQGILTKVDRASMHHSMEVRVPFLDRRVLDFAWRIRPRLGHAHREPKLILKRAMNHYFPPEIVTKEKKGFAMPFEFYLRNQLRAEVEGLTFDCELFGSSHYDAGLLRRYVRDYLDSGAGSGWGVWIVYAMQKWASNHGFA